MTTTTITTTNNRDTNNLHDRFEVIRRAVETHGRFAFRHLPCPGRRDDAVAEMVAIAWKWFLRIIASGRDPADFPKALARFAARAVRSGRRLAGQEKPHDILSPRAQFRGGFRVEPLPWYDTDAEENLALDALRDNHTTPPPDQAHFRLEFPRWVATYSPRDRSLLLELMRGERTLDVATKFGLTPGRVSQMRREFCSDWARFCGEIAT